MGRWFPDHRKGSPEQVRAYDQAQRELNENSDREHRAWKAAGRKGGAPESERYHELNTRAARAAEPLSGVQRSALAWSVRDDARAFRERRAQRQQRRAQRPGRAR